MSISEKQIGSGRREASHSGPFGAWLFVVCEALAVFGGIALLVVTAFTVVSVVGRTAFDSPVLGDQEIVEIGVAIALFSFMPYCQMRAANVIVGFFTAGLSLPARAFLDALMNSIFSACIVIVTWRLAVGGLGAFKAGDASMFLRLPQWWGYGAAFVACLFWTLACLYSVVRSVGDMRGAAKEEGA